jgi:hypothetical protein
VDLLAYNPSVREHVVPDEVVWTTEHLRTVARAVVAVRGWHTGRFYVSTFEQTPDILRFVEPAALGFAARLLGEQKMAKILCLPALPASGELKKNTIRTLKEKGIDGVISFRTMLLELVSRVGAKRNYEKSDLLQVIRLLKNYDLLKDNQMELFTRRRRSGPKPAAAPRAEAKAKGGDGGAAKPGAGEDAEAKT